MKSSSAVPANGSVLQTVTEQRVLPGPPAPKERTTPEFWPYVEGLTPGERQIHIFYLYRVVDNKSQPLEKLTTHIEVEGRSIPIDNQEEVEMAIAQKYGGRNFRIIVKRGSERVTETRLFVDAPPKSYNPPPFGEFSSGPTVQTAGDATADVAKTAITTIAGRDQQAVDVAVRALSGAADVVSRLSTPTPAAHGQDDLTRQFMAAMLARAMEDPFEKFIKFMTVMAQMNGGGGGATNPTFQKVIDTAVERLMSPPAAHGPAVSAGAELVRQLPAVAGYVSQAISEWRVGMEAQRDTVIAARGGQPANRPAAPTPTVLPAAPPHPNPSAEGTEVSGAPSLEFIEARIIEILREPISAGDAANNVLAFLETLDPQMTLVGQLKAQGEAGLLQLFQLRPVLKPATTNLPRLQEFIKAFLKLANEGTEPNPPAVH